MFQFVLSYGLAIGLRLTSLSSAALGIVIQRKSHVRNDAKPTSLQRNAIKRPLWHAGFWLYIFSSIAGDVIGISSLPLLVVALSGTLLLLFNAVFSHLILRETMSKMGWFGTVVVACASAGLAMLLNIPTRPKNADDVRKLVKKPLYIAYSAATLCVIVLVSISAAALVRMRNRTLRMHQDVALSPTTCDASESQSARFPLLTTFSSMSIDRCNLWIAFLYMAQSTIIAALALVFAKVTFDLLASSIDNHRNEFKDPISIVFLLITVATTVVQLIYFNLSLHYYPTLFTIPFGYSLGIILACVNTLIYYDALFALPAWKTVTVILCMVTTIVGIYVLSK